jgi:hypothetical protein
MTTTYTAVQGSASYPVPSNGGGVVNFQWGGYTFAAEASPAETLGLFYVPHDSKIVEGFVRGDDIDTGTETLDFDVGTAADTDALGNFGVVTGDVVTEVKPVAGIWLPFNGTLKDGPLAFSADTQIIMTFNDDPAAGGTGHIWAGAFYICNR